jgi:hypothetical protein
MAAKKREISVSKTEFNNLTHEKRECHRTLALPKVTKDKIESEKRKKNEIEKKLGTGANTVKEKLKVSTTHRYDINDFET